MNPLAQLVHVINHLVAHLDALACLLQRIFVSVDLRQDGTVLELELADYEDFSHPIRYALFFQVDQG